MRLGHVGGSSAAAAKRHRGVASSPTAAQPAPPTPFPLLEEAAGAAAAAVALRASTVPTMHGQPSGPAQAFTSNLSAGMKGGGCTARQGGLLEQSSIQLSIHICQRG